MIGWSLVVISAIWGLLAFLVFRRFTDRTTLRKVVKRIYAHLLEIRLFSDEPALVWRAQKALIGDNLRFLALVALPMLVMALPFALLYGQLDSVFGLEPLQVGHSAIVTAQLSHEVPADGAQYILQPPSGIALETPAVRNFADRQISWRIRALMPVRGKLRLVLPEGNATRSIAAGDRTLSPNRHRESSAGAVWVEVDYPRATVKLAGLSLPWLAWFLIVSTASAAVFTIWPRRGSGPPTRRPIPAV